MDLKKKMMKDQNENNEDLNIIDLKKLSIERITEIFQFVLANNDNPIDENIINKYPEIPMLGGIDDKATIFLTFVETLERRKHFINPIIRSIYERVISDSPINNLIENWITKVIDILSNDANAPLPIFPLTAWSKLGGFSGKSIPKYDVPKYDVPKYDVPKHDVPKHDVNRYDYNKYDASYDVLNSQLYGDVPSYSTHNTTNNFENDYSCESALYNDRFDRNIHITSQLGNDMKFNEDYYKFDKHSFDNDNIFNNDNDNDYDNHYDGNGDEY
jgi:hypothetical protein